MIPDLSGDLGRAVIDGWKPLAHHGTLCGHCESIMPILRSCPNDPHPFFDQVCPDGQALFIVWADAKIALIARMHELTAPWGMAGLSTDAAEERAAAITAIPAPAAVALFADVDGDRRESQIRALVAAQRSGSVTTRREQELRPCAAADCRTGPYGTHGSFIVSARFPRQRYCCDVCRKRAERRDKPNLIGTEE